MPLSPDGIAMCHTCGVESSSEGEGIHGRGYHYRGRSGKERIASARSSGGRVRRLPQEAVATAICHKRDGERNEALDTFVYAHAALHSLISMGMRLNEEAEAFATNPMQFDVEASRVIRSAWLARS